MLIAIVSVSLLIWRALGRRSRTCVCLIVDFNVDFQSCLHRLLDCPQQLTQTTNGTPLAKLSSIKDESDEIWRSGGIYEENSSGSSTDWHNDSIRRGSPGSRTEAANADDAHDGDDEGLPNERRGRWLQELKDLEFGEPFQYRERQILNSAPALTVLDAFQGHRGQSDVGLRSFISLVSVLPERVPP